MNKNIIKQLESLPFFSTNTLRTIEPIKFKALYENLQRWVKSGELLRLKNGLYVTKTHVDRFMHDRLYVALVANKLAMPSYLSLEYILQRENLLTEATYAVTSITLKSTRCYQNRLGFFVYRHLNEKLYSGFKQRRYGQNIIYEATPAKALFDFLYLKSSFLDPHDVSTLKSLRINWSQFDRTGFGELRTIILKSDVHKLGQMIPMLEEAYDGDARE